MPRELKFARLLALLAALPADKSEIQLSLTQLAALASGPLPRGAWTSVYWSNSTVSRKNWSRIGFAAAFDRHSCTVRFHRVVHTAGAQRPANAEHCDQERTDSLRATTSYNRQE